MKKLISIFLAVLMVMTFAFVAVAEEPKCTCEDHKSAATGELCHCCLYCDNLDRAYLCHCARNADGSPNIEGPRCCMECDGVLPCDCPCCLEQNVDTDGFDPIFDEETQETIIETFQRVLGQIREFFDNFFNTIFELLRFDEIMG